VSHQRDRWQETDEMGNGIQSMLGKFMAAAK